MTTLPELDLLRDRLEKISNYEISSLAEIEEYNFERTADDIILLAANPNWKGAIEKFIAKYVVGKIHEIQKDLHEIVEAFAYSIYTKQRAIHKVELATEFLKQNETRLIAQITSEMNYYQTELVEKIGNESNLPIERLYNKLIFNLNVGQFSAFIKILLESQILDQKQTERGMGKEFARSICNLLNIVTKHKVGDSLDPEKIYNELYSPDPSDLDFCIEKFKEMQIHAANLKNKVSNRLDKSANRKK